MAVVHLIQGAGGWSMCRSVLQAGDAVLFMGDGLPSAACAHIPDDVSAFVLGGAPLADKPSLDMDGMVRLCVDWGKAITWR